MWNLDYKSFTKNIRMLEALEANMSKIADKVLEAGTEPARKAFARNVPRSKLNKPHAQDNIRAFKIGRGSKKYVIIKAGYSIKDKTFNYLHFADKKKPFFAKAIKDAYNASDWLMGMELDRQVSNHLRMKNN